MTRIFLLSDTHGYYDASWEKYINQCDEIWHAGDIGDDNVIRRLEYIKPVRAVFGNIDGTPIRKKYVKNNVFILEDVKVLMTHIAGSAGKYNSEVKELILNHKPALLICGHSHILKVMFDNSNNLLYVNPGAAGVHGFHQMKTVITFSLSNGEIKDMKVIELGKRA